MKARAERACRDSGRQLGARAPAAVRAPDPWALMLGRRDRQPRQLLDLLAHRPADRDQLALAEDVAAPTLRRPMHHNLVDRRARQQLAAPALMTGLGALLAARRVLAAPRRRPGRILAWRLRRVTRRAPRLALQLTDALLLARHTRRQRLYLHRQPLVLRRQLHKHPHHDLAPLPIDRLGLGALHTTGFATTPSCPPDQLNAYRNLITCREFSPSHRTEQGPHNPPTSSAAS